MAAEPSFRPPPQPVSPDRPRFRLPDEVTPAEVAQFDQVDPVDAADVIRWLETGENDPWAVWVRRVPGFNLWVFYRFGDSEVVVLTVATSPPIPLDE
jgi:hypothetical protein